MTRLIGLLVGGMLGSFGAGAAFAIFASSRSRVGPALAIAGALIVLMSAVGGGVGHLIGRAQKTDPPATWRRRLAGAVLGHLASFPLSCGAALCAIGWSLVSIHGLQDGLETVAATLAVGAVVGTVVGAATA